MVINGVEYVRKDSVSEQIEVDEDYVIIRTYSAGVHAGYLMYRDGKEVELKDSRRIWKWTGASSLSELAIKGSNDISGCKIPCSVPKVILTEAIEIINCTEVAKNQLIGASVWTQH